MQKIGHVVFVEDKFYLLWQLELFLESLISRGKIEQENIVVLYADPNYHDPTKDWSVSKYLNSIMQEYSSVKYFCVQNWGRRNWYFRFKDDGTWNPRQYAGITKWLSLCEAANAGWLDCYDEILLLEQDLWFSDTLPKLPKGNCVTSNWICDRHKAFSVTDKSKKDNTEGFDLDEIMSLCKVSEKNQKLWTSGAIIFKFVTKQLKKAKFLNAIVNYHQLLMTLGELSLPQGARHETDMVAPSLAMAHCGMRCKEIKDIAWKSDVWTYNSELPSNSLVHYGWDFSAHKHLKSSFSKFVFDQKGPWTNDKIMQSEYKHLPFNWLRLFYEDIAVIGSKDLDRDCQKTPSAPVI